MIPFVEDIILSTLCGLGTFFKDYLAIYIFEGFLAGSLFYSLVICLSLCQNHTVWITVVSSSFLTNELLFNYGPCWIFIALLLSLWCAGLVVPPAYGILVPYISCTGR